MPGRPSKAGTESASIFYLALSSTRLVSELLDLDAATVAVFGFFRGITVARFDR